MKAAIELKKKELAILEAMDLADSKTQVAYTNYKYMVII